MEPFVLSSYTTTKTQLNISKDEIHQRINLIATALNLYTTATNDHIRISISSAEHTEYYEDLKDVLIMHRQHAYYVNGLINFLAKTKVEIDQCLKLFKEKINSIHEVVKFRTAIPTEKIFVGLLKGFSRLQAMILYFFFSHDSKSWRTVGYDYRHKYTFCPKLT